MAEWGMLNGADRVASLPLNPTVIHRLIHRAKQNPGKPATQGNRHPPI